MLTGTNNFYLRAPVLAPDLEVHRADNHHGNFSLSGLRVRFQDRWSTSFTDSGHRIGMVFFFSSYFRAAKVNSEKKEQDVNFAGEDDFSDH